MSVLSFPHTKRDEAFIPTPVNYSPSLTYERIDVEDDSLIHMGYFPGAALTAIAGHLQDRHLNALEFEGEVFLGILIYLDAFRAAFHSWHRGRHSGVYPLTDLPIVGAVIEGFPHGIHGPRWVYGTPSTVGTENAHLGRMLKASAI